MKRLIPPASPAEADAPAGAGGRLNGMRRGLPDLLDAGLDAATLAYVHRAQPAFDLLRQAEGQLAGLMVLAAAGSRSASPDHPMLGSARRAFEDGLGRLRGVEPPRRGRHHHLHLGEAAELIGLALRRADAALRRPGDAKADIGAALEPLKRAHRHLQWATTALPGFEMVAFEQGCCAAHAGVAAPGERNDRQARSRS